MFYELYVEFVSAFRTASEALRRGNRDAPSLGQMSNLLTSSYVEKFLVFFWRAITA